MTLLRYDTMRKNLFSMCFIALNLIITGCDESTGPEVNNMPTNGKYIEIIAPSGGEVYHVGDTVTIQFKIDGLKIDGVLPDLSIDSGKTWFINISDSTILCPETDGALKNYSWIIGQERETIPYVGTITGCKIKVYKYDFKDGSREVDRSEMFTVTKQ